MRSLLLLALLGLTQNPLPTGARAAEAPLAREWIPALGEVRIDALGPLRLRVATTSPNPRTFELELDGFGPGARVLDARASSFLGSEIALALAVEHDATTSYHYLLRRPGEGEAVATEVRLAPKTSEGGWGLSPAIFESQGEPYRIVEMHNPGGDTIEITFRRGFPKGISTYPAAVEVDEKIFYDVCPGLTAFVGELYDVGSARSNR